MESSNDPIISQINKPSLQNLPVYKITWSGGQDRANVAIKHIHNKFIESDNFVAMELLKYHLFLFSNTCLFKGSIYQG